MLSNFHLCALAKLRGGFQLFHVPLHQSLQDLLRETWAEHLEEFASNIEEIDLNIGYIPEEHERFRLSDFVLQTPLTGIDSMNIQNLDSLAATEEILKSIKAIVAFCRDSKGAEVVLFQNVTPSHVVEPGRFLFLPKDTYVSSVRPGLTLDSRLSAVYSPNQKRLLFHSFRVANTFLPLTEYYMEASEEEITKILKHKALAPEDVKAVASNANQWFSKRFAMLKDSRVLDKYTPKQIRARSRGHDVEVVIESGKIVFPAEKVAAKRLLQFLNEELYRGPITETLYETNSK